MKAQGQFVTGDECDQLARLLDRKYASILKQKYFEAETRRDGIGVYAKIILRTKSGSFYYPVEGRLPHMDHDMSERDAALFLFDYIGEYFDEYLREGGEVFLPIDWSEYEEDGVAVQLRGQILNLEAERLADELLAGKKPDVALH